MHIPALSPNITIFAIIIIATLYGAMSGKQKLRVLILSVYVGIVLATELAAVAVAATHQAADIITLALFAAPIMLFGFGGGSHGKHENKGTMIANLLVGLATGGLIVASALKILPPSEAKVIADNSLVADILLQYQLWLVGLLPLVALLFGMMKPKEHKH